MGIEDSNVDAFKEPLKVSELDDWSKMGYEAKLREFASDGSWIVRAATPAMFADGKCDTPSELASQSRALFDEVNEQYLPVAPREYVVAANERGENTFFTLTKRLETVPLSSLDASAKADALHEMKDHISSLIRYYREKENLQSDFLTDIVHFQQFAFGRIDSESPPHWYLVDTDPIFRNDPEALHTAVINVRGLIEDTETAFDVRLPVLEAERASLEREISKMMQLPKAA